MKGRNKKCYGLFLALFVIFGLSLSVSLDVNAEAFNRTYSQSSVNFYSDTQHSATVNLPWNVNPGVNTFYLNSAYFDENSWLGYKLSYVSGRMVMQIAPYTTTNFYVCGVDTSYAISNGTITQCVGSLTIRYSDGTSTVMTDNTVYINQTSSPYRITIYFDYQGETSSDKTISLMQYEFKARTGYDVVSRNTVWNNTTLFQFVEGRGTVNVYETPPSGAEIANDLLQQQIGQNQTIIQQNQQTYNYLTDDTPPTADTSVLGSSSGWLPAGPVDSVLTLPVQLAQGIVNVFTNPGQCSALSLPLPWIDYNLQIPCVGPLMDAIGFTPIWGIIGGIISAFIIYDTLKWLYKFVDDTLTLRENNSTMWGGL